MQFFLSSFFLFCLLFSTASGFLSSSCRKRGEVCRASGDCCPVLGHRIVCAPHRKICGKKTCCVTEVEEQQERQAAIIRNRNPKLKQMLSKIMGQ
ncbi:unnamed protein product [Rotaria socialis]|uniref:Uncharacterized protein n=1 Tax=Rotaria socialis TaxID=392032 RepID=A0A818LQR7_9BILA|nr:unnamed protein product [Rotaria socialis]CAF3380722.1 unnamed protein product [Rotaria socialis]CAF3439260.1 unnamed protein product [Rotaria socialis]CAF3569207.1 unnamed protein product [Rotaria socialis]CAF3779648.1 unnamed protein product [Rotaria socialis]